MDKNRIKRLWGFLKPYWHLELATFLVMAVLVMLALALPAAIQYMIDTLIPGLVDQIDDNIDVTPVIYFGLFLMGIYLAKVIISWLRDYLATYIGAHIITDMRLQLFEHLEKQSLIFFQTHRVGEIMSRLLSDINNVQSLLTDTLLMFLTNLLMFTGIFVYLMTIDWILTLIALVPVPLTIILIKRFGIRLHSINKALQETIAYLSARFQESLIGIKTIKAFGQEKSEKEHIGSILNNLIRIYIQNSVATSLSVNFTNFFNMIEPIIVLAWGTYLVASGVMKLGELIAFYILLTYLYSPIQGLASVHIEVKRAMASVDRMFEYLDLSEVIEEKRNAVSINKAKGTITIKDLHFNYGKGKFGISALNLEIKAGEKVAIVGSSGSGKTTLANLIMRFYDPLKGMICLDGIDMKNITFKSLRENISIVDQEPLLFGTSIYNNIAYALPDASLENVINAAKAAKIHDFIDGLPDKYNSEIGERGVTISGGEKQRICLARAILRSPSILILDEATSALDSNSEQLIQESLKTVLADKTAIIIAHRLSTVQYADRIIVIDNGKIIDEGTHDELLEKSPLYRELARNQLKLESGSGIT